MPLLNLQIAKTAIIEEGVELGDNTIIQEHVIIRKGSKIGSNCKIFPFAVIGEEPQDKSYSSESSFVIIGNNNTIREFVTIHRAVGEGQITRIGDNNYLMANSHIAHNVSLGNNITLANGVTLGGHVSVEDFVTIGGHTAVHQHCRIGRLAMISGMSALNHDALPYITYFDVPSRAISTNRIGMKKANFDQALCSEIMRAFKIIYGQKNSLPTILHNLSKLKQYPEILHLIDFIKNSKRNIVLKRTATD